MRIVGRDLQTELLHQFQAYLWLGNIFAISYNIITKQTFVPSLLQSLWKMDSKG